MNKMKINLIVAHELNGGIGNKNQLPWKMLKKDLVFFKEKTLNKTIVLGSNTFRSLPRILPQREHYILSSNKTLKIDNEKVKVFNDIKSLLLMAKKKNKQELWIIGGGVIYREFMPIATDLYITEVQARLDVDVLFPNWNKQDFILRSQSRISADCSNQYDCIFSHWEKRGI